ncbi:MAG TPA: hypothetical protein VG013_42460 [Gemmataceae bacterium]|nr:hypothetical protein [Gemmataceae bacterium]
MTESEWLAGKDSRALLEAVRGQVSDRKLRLFACAWCRQTCGWWGDPDGHKNLGIAGHARSWLWKPTRLVLGGGLYLLERLQYQPTDSWIAAANELVAAARTALAVAERFADGQAAEEERAAAYRAAADWSAGWCSVDVALSYEAGLAASAADAVEASTRFLPMFDPYLAGPVGERGMARDRARQASLLREIIGNPFRPMAVEGRWLSGGDGAALELAQEIYDRHRFSMLGRLASVLRQAGCNNRELVRHCRSPGPHYRGCWALDALLGKA